MGVVWEVADDVTITRWKYCVSFYILCHYLRRMCDFSPSDLVVSAVALDDDEKERKLKKRKLWVHPMLGSRKSVGEFHTLYPRLIDDESKFFNYFRMSMGTFKEILSKTQHQLKRENTPYREAITPREKLAVCIR